MGVCLYIPFDMSSDRTFLEPFSKLGEVRKIEEAPGLAAAPRLTTEGQKGGVIPVSLRNPTLWESHCRRGYITDSTYTQ